MTAATADQSVPKSRRTCPGLPRLLWPAVAYLAIFYVAPLGQLLALSARDAADAWSLSQFARLFSVPLYQNVLLNTLEIALTVAGISVALAYPAAYLIETGSRRRARLLVVFVLVPFFTSLLVRNYAWIFLLGQRGVINTTLLTLGVIDRPLPLMFNRFGVIVGMVHILLPYSVLVLMAVMRGIDRRVVMAAGSLAAGPFTAFRRVFLPLSAPGVVGAFLLVFVLALAFFVTPAMLGGPRDLMIANLIANEMGQLNWNFASALSVVLLAISLAVIVVLQILFGATSFADQSFSNPRSRRVRWMPRLAVATYVDRVLDPLWPYLAPIIGAAVLGFLFLPILVMIPLSFSSAAFFVFPPPGFSLQWYEAFVDSPEWIAAVRNSFLIAAAAGVLTIALAVPAALAISRSRSWVVTATYALLLSPMVVPGIIIAVALFFLLSPMRLTGTLAGVAIGHVVGGLPIALVVLVTALRNFDRTLERAALGLGASPLRTVLKITLPVIGAAVAMAAFLAFLHSFDELLVALFISGVQTPTLPKKMWESLQEINPTITAVSTLLVAFTVLGLAALAATEGIINRRRKTR